MGKRVWERNLGRMRVNFGFVVCSRGIFLFGGLEWEEGRSIFGVFKKGVERVFMRSRFGLVEGKIF